MNKTFFTSDIHFGHKNILKFGEKTRKGHTCIEEMNSEIIEIWNSQVSENDDVYIIGDMFLCRQNKVMEILPKLNGNLHLIKGNHDTWISQEAKRFFKSIKEYSVIRLDDIKVVMFHYPIIEWDGMHRGAFHLYGHTHGSLALPGRAMDVGIDARPNDMKLWEWEEIKEILIKKEILSHHGKKNIILETE